MPETPPPSSQKRSIFTPQAEDPAQNQPAVPARRTTLPVSLSLILLGSAIIIGGVIVGWTSFFQQTDNIQISLESVSAQPAGNLEMTGARYSGTTENGLKFSINAERAVESASKKGWSGCLHLMGLYHQTRMERLTCPRMKRFIIQLNAGWI